GVLYAHTVLARRMARRAAKPLVLTEHVGRVPYRGAVLRAVQDAAWRVIGDATLAQASAVVALNDRVRAWLAARGAAAAPELIPNGVDLDRFGPGDAVQRTIAREALGLPAEGVLGLMVGRDTPKKHRAAAIGADRAGWTLVLAGAPVAIHGAGVHDLGVLAGETMPLLYHACDFLVHLAEGEGFPMAVQEAMATGLPVALAWDAGYASTLDRDAVLAGDGIAATMRGAQALAADAALRTAVGGRGRAWATSRWSWDEAVARYEAVYGRVARNGGAPA
ncbi:MAG: glycosyltransferase, partial [Gemmatimonadetes bacterium]|nr:glycosyltransferase [Gemmatimonadota bacterium]